MSLDKSNINTTEVTHVTRLIVELGTDGNINASLAPDQVELGAIELNEITGSSVTGLDFTLPSGNYEVFVQLNLRSNANRTNFYLDIRNGTTVLKTVNGGLYARNANGHNDVGENPTFTITNTSGGTFNLATRREANSGDVDQVGGWLIIKRYEQKIVIVP